MSKKITISIPDPHLYDEFNPGDQVYLISWFDESRARGNDKYKIQKNVPTTNMSGEDRESGWLGCTDSINKTAHGLHEIDSMEMLTRKAKGEIIDEVGVKFVLSEVIEND